MTRRRSFATVVLLGLCAPAGFGVAGCGGTGRAAGESTVTRNRDPVTIRRVHDESQCKEADALAVFGKSDGWTFSHTLTVCAGGRVDLEYSSRGVLGPHEEARMRYEITAGDVRRLETALDDANLATLRESYTGAGADLPFYRITRGSSTVYADDFAIADGKVPDQLLGLIGRFGLILDPAVEDAEKWMAEDPTLVLEYREEEARRIVERCRAKKGLSAGDRRTLKRLEAFLRGGITKAEVDKVYPLLHGNLALC